MKILFVSLSIEEQMRGINVIINSLIKAAKADGHEVGMLVGYPSPGFKKSLTIDSKLEHLDLQHYLQDGRESFQYLIPGGYRRRNLPRLLLTALGIFHSKEIKINPEYLAGNAGYAKQLDFVVRSPFIYQLLVRNYQAWCRYLIKRIVAKHKVDLVLCASPTILRSQDVGNAKLVQFVHDAMPIEIPETPPDNQTPTRFAKQFYTTVSGSDLILTNSKDTSRKVLDVNPKANVQIVYGTASAQPEDIPPTAILEDYKLEPKGYLLFTSVLEKRKNLENLLDAFAMLAGDIKQKLVLVGGHGYGYHDIRLKYKSLPSEVRRRIVFTDFISEADKYTLFKNASLFVFPSLYEGFGLVIIEAMANNLPVVTSNRGALPEAGGNAAQYIDDPYNPAQIAQAILAVIKDPKRQQDMIIKGQQRVKDFSQAKFDGRFAKALKTLGRA